jgi:beta-1,4-N-acetylglucosaminyltransferase
MSPFEAIAIALVLLLIAASLRLLFILPPYRPKAPRRMHAAVSHLMIVLGSGGHTTEMLLGLRGLDPQKYAYRTWVVSSGDAFSAERAREFEDGLGSAGSYEIVTIPRARRVHQGLLTTPITALQCFIACFRLLLHRSPSPASSKLLYPYPDAIVTNGPGTAVIVVLATILLRFFDISGRANNPAVLRTVYFESWARVDQLSLSGKLLLRVVDRFVVQWPQLQQRTGGGAEYRGWLVLNQQPVVGE